MNDFLAAAEKMRDQRAARVTYALDADTMQPDVAAKAMQNAASLGLPKSAGLIAPDGLERDARMAEAAKLLRGAPKTAAWLSDMGNGVLAKDDIENASWFERGLRNFAEIGDPNAYAGTRAIKRGVLRIPLANDVGQASGAAAIISDVGRSFDDLVAEEMTQIGGESAPAQMRAAAIEAARIRFERASGVTPEVAQSLVKQGADALVRARERADAIAGVAMSGPATAFRDQTLSDADNTLMGTLKAFAANPTGGAAFVLETAAEFLPAMAAASAVTTVTRSPAAGAIVMGGASGLTENASSAMDFLSEQGVKLETPEDAAAVLQNTDLMQAARDRGLARGLVIGVMDALSGGVAGKQLMRSPVGDMIAQGAAQVGFGAGGEAMGQIAAGQQVSWKDIVIEGLAELATAPVEVLGVGGRRLLKGSVDAARAGDLVATLSEVEQQAMASKLRARDPEAFKALLDAQGLGDKDVYVPADALREYFQAKDMSLDDETLRAWGIDPMQFEESASAGTDVAIPMSNVATYFAGTDDAKWIAENATIDPNEMSAAMAKAFNASVQDVMQEAFDEAERARISDEELRAADVQIYDQMFSQLRAAGRSPDVAQNEARVWSAFWRTMGERYGEDPLDLARQMGVQVRGPQFSEFRRRDQLDIALNMLRTKGEKALKPKGLSLAEFVKAKGGIQDVGGDVAALEPPKGVVAETAQQAKDRASQPALGGMSQQGKGVTIDEMGRMAAEAGYFPDLLGEVTLGTKGEASDFAARLLKALSEDVAGRKVYAEGEGQDADMQALSDALSERGIDIATATNDEIVAALNEADGQTYNQDGTLKTDTPEFRAWFGDSKVVDDEGKPLVVYHGTAADVGRKNFRFMEDRIGSATDAGHVGRGFYFANTKGEAGYYGPNIAAVYLSLQNPLDLTNNTGDLTFSGHFLSWAPKMDAIGALSEDQKQALDAMQAANSYVEENVRYVKAVSQDGAEGWSAKVSNPAEGFTDEIHMRPGLRGTFPATKEEALDNLKYQFRNEMERFHKEVYPGLGTEHASVSDYVRTELGAARLTELATAAGHDGIIWGDEYVAFRPEQIKSVYNRGTFDPNDPRILYQPAYHGSPHIFDRFSTEFMGSGEGAQAFGWGMYFAGRKGVAEYYRESLTPRPGVEAGPYSSRLQYKGELFSRVLNDHPEWATTDDSRSEVGRKVDNLSRALWAHVEKQGADPIVTVDNWLAEQERFEQGLTKPPYDSRGDGLAIIRAMRDMPTPEWVEPKGRLYKVDIPEDSDLLAWDAPLSEQSEKVREKLAPLVDKIASLPDKNGPSDRARDAVVSGSGDGSQFYSMLQRAFRDQAYADGQALTAAMAKTGAGWTPENIARNAEIEDRYQNSDRAASEALRDAGIPGHRFLDQGSRGQGEGSYNYVIYDDSAVSVLEFEQGKRGSIVLPSGGLGNGQTVINLFEGADLSTFLHESGHFFLEAFSDLASRSDAPQAMRDDLSAIREWLGNDGGPLTVEQHEKWARGFEAYTMEGKAPSLALADAFARFKAWLTRIYRTALGLNVKITPEIREVMDRMLATDAEIAQARQAQEMRPLFSAAPPGMSEGDFATYQRVARRATESAEQRLLDKTMAKVRREREAWFKAEKKAVWTEVSAEYDRQPRYRLIDMLANQVWVGAEAGVEVPDMQIDRKMLVEQFGDGVLAEVSRSRFGGKRAIYGDNGASPEEVAQFFGFPGASDMISILQNTPKKRDAIATEVDRRMTERHGDPLNDGSIEEEALAAIHNEQQANLAVTEARHIARQLGRATGSMTAKLYRQRARAMVGRMTVKDAIRPERFLAAERKAARAAQDAFAKVARGTGKAESALAEALQAKEQQILNGFLYDEARQVAEYVQRGRERMRDYSKKTVREKLEGGYIEQIDAILDDYDFRVLSQKRVARSESLKSFVERMIDEGREGDLNIDARLMDEANRKHYTRMSVDELRGLFDTIENIDHMGRFKQKLIDRKRARDLRESVDRLVTQIRSNLGSGKAGERHKVAAAFNLLWRTDTLLVRMDGGQEIGPAYDEIKRSIDEATSEEQNMYVEMAERLDKLFSEHYTAAALRKMRVERDIPGANGRPWSKMEILAVALNAGNEDNFARLTADDAALRNRLTKDHVRALLAEMTETDWRFVQGMWDMVNSYWGGLSEVAKRRTGVTPKKINAKLMVDAPAFVTGGYYPIKYDPQLSAAAAADEASGWDKFTATGRGATAAIRNGMTMQRQKTGNGRTLRLDVSVAFAHMRDTIRYIALSEAVDNAYRLISQPDVQNAFLDAGARDQHDVLRLWLKDVASGPAPSPDALNTVSRIMKNNFTLSRLALNFKTVALQVTGVGQSAATIGKKNMVRGYLEYLQNPYDRAKSVTAMSAFMAERQTTFQKDIYDFMDETQISGPASSTYKKAKAGLAKIGFAPIVWTQFWGVDMPTWLGAFRSGIEKYGDEQKAIHFADRMVARAQDSGLMADRSAIERGTLSEGTRQSDFVRLFTTLGGYMLTKLNRAYVTAMQAKTNFREADTGAQKVAISINAATDMMLLYLTEAVMTGLIYALMADGDDDDDLKRFLLTETGSAMVGGVPVVRDVYSAVAGYGGGGIYGSLADAPSNFLKQAAQGENDKALRRSIADIVGMMTGLPTTGPMRAIEGALDENVPLSEAIFGRNPLGR